MNRFFLLIVLIVALIGCQKHCIKLDGKYKDFEGGIEYCFDASKSTDTIPVVTNDKGDFALIGLKDIEAANKLLEGANINSKAKEKTKEKSKIQKFLDLVRSKK